MPKAKKKRKGNTFDYSKDRKKLKKQFKKRETPRIECPQIRNAWSDKKSVARNLRDMGLAFDPNRALPIKTPAIAAVGRTEDAPAPKLVRKPYVLNELVAEASLPEKDTKTLSTDLIEYVQYMVREHSENYKAMARDEKNYYQDTPSQIRRKVDQYKRCHPEEYTTFMESLKGGKQFPHNWLSVVGKDFQCEGGKKPLLFSKYSVTVAKMNRRWGSKCTQKQAFLI